MSTLEMLKIKCHVNYYYNEINISSKTNVNNLENFK